MGLIAGFLFGYMMIILEMIWDRPKEYQPDPSLGGYYVNKGDEFNEEWEWVELPKRKPVVVSAISESNKTEIIIDNFEIPGCNESVLCEAEWEIKATIEHMKAYYRAFGDVKVEFRVKF